MNVVLREQWNHHVLLSDRDVLLESGHLIFRPIDGVNRAGNKVRLHQHQRIHLQRIIVLRPLISPHMRDLPVPSVKALKVLQRQELQVLVLVDTPMDVMVEPVLPEEIDVVDVFVLVKDVTR